MKKIITILIGLLGVFVAAGLILPALAKVRDFGAMPSEAVGFYTLGVALGIGGVGTALFGLRRRNSA